MKKILLIALALTLTAFFMQIPVGMVSPLSTVCAQEEEAESVEAPPEEEGAAVININTATAEELATLEGIGDKTAQNIVEYREANGPFATIEDIKNVKGIGDKKLAKIRESITLE